MSRPPVPGVGARSPSGRAAPSPSPAPTPSRYRALRARYNALLVTLYERSALTLREIASLAGRTDRAVHIMVRALGCRPRNAKTCRPGTNVGIRRAGAPLPRLNATATQRVAAAFAAVARDLAAYTKAREADEFARAASRAKRRVARTQARVLASTARRLTYLAATIEDLATLRAGHTPGPKRSNKRSNNRSGAHKPAKAPTRSPPDIWRTQDRVLREQEVRMWDAHRAAREAARKPPPAPTLSLDPAVARRIDAIAERYYARSEGRPEPPANMPRIRRLW